MPGDNSRLVYSTDGIGTPGDKRVRAAKAAPPVARGRGAKQPPADVPNDGFVRIKRETKGRGGKTVTTVTGLPGSEADVEAMLKVLKQLCGAGGTREGTTLELQGDHRTRVQAKLEALGHRVKLAGG